MELSHKLADLCQQLPHIGDIGDCALLIRVGITRVILFS